MSEIQKYLDEGFKFIPAVVGFVIDEENQKVLLGFRQGSSTGLGLGLYSGLGGKARDSEEIKDETDEEATIRELREEAGIEVKEDDLEYKGRVRFIFPHKPNWSHDVKIFIIKKWQGEPQVTEEGKIIPKWVDLNNMPWENMWEDNRHWVARAIAGEMIDDVYLYGEDGRVK